jgi:3-dehydroquinate synthase
MSASDPATAHNRDLIVDLEGRGYAIDIGSGLIAKAGQILQHQFGNRLFVPVMDASVAGSHGKRLVDGLEAVGLRHTEPVIVPSGEASKSWPGYEALVEGLLDRGVDRRSVVLALGGGVVGDLAGFAAASVLRGLDFVQLPTTLLSQVDSSVGGKTGINTRHGKNLVGAFHQPRRVLIDIDTLETLPMRERRAGYAEVVKYGLLGDRDFFEWLEANGQAVLDGSPAALVEAIHRSCAAKAAIVAADEREAGQRALLNLGHTFGHALEAEAAFDGTLLHGEAVSIGMALAFRLSVEMGLCPAADMERTEAHLARLGLPLLPSEGAWRSGMNAAKLLAHMAHDKKASDGRLTFILVRGIGQAFITSDVPVETVTKVLDAFLARLSRQAA